MWKAKCSASGPRSVAKESSYFRGKATGSDVTSEGRAAEVFGFSSPAFLSMNVHKYTSIFISIIFLIQSAVCPPISYALHQPSALTNDDFAARIKISAREGIRPSEIKNILEGLDMSRIRQIITLVEDPEIRLVLCEIFEIKAPVRPSGLPASTPGAGVGKGIAEVDGKLYAGKDVLQSFGMTYSQFRKFCRDIFAFEEEIKKDINLFKVSRYLISLRSQWRLANDILFILSKLKERNISKAFSHALIYSLYNNYIDLASTDEDISIETKLLFYGFQYIGSEDIRRVRGLNQELDCGGDDEIKKYAELIDENLPRRYESPAKLLCDGGKITAPLDTGWSYTHETEIEDIITQLSAQDAVLEQLNPDDLSPGPQFSKSYTDRGEGDSGGIEESV